MSDATIEVDGAVYALTNPTYYAGEAIEGMTQTGRSITGLRGEPFIEASVSGWEFATVVIRNNDPREAIPCRVTMGGAVVFTARACAVEWSPNPPVTQLRIENLVAIPATPATPTLDELTDPADIDWGTIRSTCAARDWRAAWGVVGTDHAGDATPGEVYLLAVARRASATAAVLRAWLACAMPTFTMAGRPAVAPTIHKMMARKINEDAGWQRIKRIAAWESSARAQYDERGNRRGRLQAAVREAATQARLYGRGDTADALAYGYSVRTTINGVELNDTRGNSVTVTEDANSVLRHLQVVARATQAADPAVRPTSMWIDGATLDALRQQAAVIDDPVEPDPELYGNGRGVVGLLNNPFLTAAAQRDMIHFSDMHVGGTSATIAAALERYASLTGNAMNVQGNGRGGIVVTPRNTNPAPRGPQTRKRR